MMSVSVKGVGEPGDIESTRQAVLPFNIASAAFVFPAEAGIQSTPGQSSLSHHSLRIRLRADHGFVFPRLDTHGATALGSGLRLNDGTAAQADFFE